MKRYRFLIITFVATAIGMASCKKFLERPPEGQLTKEEALKDEQGLVNFANGINTLVGDADFMGGRYQVLSELLGDEYKGDKFTGDFSEIYKRQNTYFGGTRDGFYKKAYAVVNRSNIILDNLALATSQKNVLEGEARFFRGMANFELVRLFAQPYGASSDNDQLGIPLRLAADISNIGRSTVKQVYDQIIADLKVADTLLPSDPAGGKFVTPTKWAAKAYLAKVYFQMNDFADAYKYAGDVISSNKFQLDTSYTSRFSLDATTAYNTSKEGIYLIKNEGTSYNPGSELRGNFRSDIAAPGFLPTDQFYAIASQKATDRRKIWYSSTLYDGLKVLTKYNANFFDLPIVHLTEIKLIRAESGAELGAANLPAAIADLNELLVRAYGNSAAIPTTTIASSVIATVRHERELEMVGEGNRVQEIKRIGVRTGISVDRRNSPWNCPGFILQFPKSEVDANSEFQLNPEGGCF